MCIFILTAIHILPHIQNTPSTSPHLHFNFLFPLPSIGLTRLESEASRLAPEQPLEFTEHTIHHQAKRLHYNLRKLSELPFHLVKSRRITDLKQFVVFNYEWLYTKLQAMSLHDIISDFRYYWNL